MKKAKVQYKEQDDDYGEHSKEKSLSFVRPENGE